MATQTTIPMIDPQGEIRMIPLDQRDAALKSGGKVAIKMKAPDGSQRWIATDEFQDAVKAGGRPIPIGGEIDGPKDSPVSRFLSSGWDALTSGAKGFIAPFRGASTPGQVVSNVGESVVQGAADEGSKAAENFKQSAPLSLHPTQEQKEHRQLAAGHVLAAALPGVGPWVASVGEKVGTQAGEGDYAGAGGTLAGNTAIYAAAEALPKLAHAIPPSLRGGSEIITGTGPKVAKELAKDTAKDNAAAVEDADARNAAQAAKRSEQVKTHFAKTQAAKQAQEDASAAATRKEALSRGVEHLDPEIKGELEKTEDTVNAEANRRYEELNAKLDPIEANPEFFPSALDDAMQKIKGSDTETTILKDMGKKVQRGEVLSYRDLQGYRSELGRELRKGTLPGDVYHAYKGLQDSITDEMERIAKNNGMEDQFKDARDYYRRYAEAFLDRNSPVRKALDTAEPSSRYKSLSSRMTRNGKDVNALEVVAEYNPELAKRIGTVRGYQAESKSIRPSAAGAKEPPPLAPKPKPVVPETKTISMEDIRGAKGEALAKRAAKIRSRGDWIATGAAGYRALSSILHGNLGAVPSDLLEGGIAVAGVEGISRVLENPKVVKFLTEPTAKDVAQIPPELRSDIRTVTQIAQKRGIKVNPALLAAVGASSFPKGHALSRVPAN